MLVVLVEVGIVTLGPGSFTIVETQVAGFTTVFTGDCMQTARLFPTKENSCGMQPRAKHDLAKRRAAQPRAETNPLREKLHFE